MWLKCQIYQGFSFCDLCKDLRRPFHVQDEAANNGRLRLVCLSSVKGLGSQMQQKQVVYVFATSFFSFYIDRCFVGLCHFILCCHWTIHVHIYISTGPNDSFQTTVQVCIGNVYRIHLYIVDLVFKWAYFIDLTLRDLVFYSCSVLRPLSFIQIHLYSVYRI